MRTINRNLPALINGKKLTGEYDGYASCPLMVSLNRVVLAEFNADGPLETLPINGAKPRYSSYLIKRYFLPFLYWNFLIKGTWLGPATFRKIFHLVEAGQSTFKKGKSAIRELVSSKNVNDDYTHPDHFKHPSKIAMFPRPLLVRGDLTA
ncbi:unnamed protein product [Toxocara canis]|uniref:Oxidored_molyb domain-containing protein n=1 Tax=Toxocara canis TaxID=6265 RepID=A0A183VBS9_TOXCA|nr:unnamed protein product [Toxocara canis]